MNDESSLQLSRIQENDNQVEILDEGDHDEAFDNTKAAALVAQINKEHQAELEKVKIEPPKV